MKTSKAKVYTDVNDKWVLTKTHFDSLKGANYFPSAGVNKRKNNGDNKMKTMILTVFLFVTASSFAAGFVKKSFSKNFYAATETELVSLVEAAIPEIEAGHDKELTRSMKLHKCRPIHPRHIKVGKLFIKKVYQRVDAVLVPRFRGTLIVSHNHCFENNK